MSGRVENGILDEWQIHLYLKACFSPLSLNMYCIADSTYREVHVCYFFILFV